MFVMKIVSIIRTFGCFFTASLLKCMSIFVNQVAKILEEITITKKLIVENNNTMISFSRDIKISEHSGNQLNNVGVLFILFADFEPNFIFADVSFGFIDHPI